MARAPAARAAVRRATAQEGPERDGQRVERDLVDAREREVVEEPCGGRRPDRALEDPEPVAGAPRRAAGAPHVG